MLKRMTSNAEVIENGDKYLYGNHIRMPIAMKGGHGCWVYDEDEAGVKWEDLPDDFACELCGVGKEDFSPEE